MSTSSARGIYVLYTGGTLGMAPAGGEAGAALVPLPLEALRDVLEGLAAPLGLGAVTYDSLDPPLDSAAMTPSDWVTIATRLADARAEFDAFVVLHGTDTLAYTASALAFLLRDFGKPIVLTAAQEPLLAAQSDAPRNFCDALRVAEAGREGLHEVVCVCAGRVLRATRLRKRSTTDWDAFETPNCPQLGHVGDRVQFASQHLRPAPTGSFQGVAALTPHVVDITLTPALTPEHLRAMLDLPHLRGVVLRAFGAGNASDAPDFARALRDGLRDPQKVAVCITQCAHGPVAQGRYASSGALAQAGVIAGGDMTPEAALTKLMVLLATRSLAEIPDLLVTDLAGELSAHP